MRGAPVRVAVQEGACAVRVAGAAADGPAWLVAELPAPGPGVAALLAELVGPAPEELVLVHPACWPPDRALRQVREHAALACRVRAVPAPLAAAGRGGVAVLDVGAAGAEAALLAADGRVRAWAAADTGGRALDALVAARTGHDPHTARELREALSLRPDLRPVLAGALEPAVTALRRVLAGAGEPPVLLIGGLARSPLPAELLDEAGIARVVVAERPDAAAVLGALALPVGTGTAVRSRGAGRGGSGGGGPRVGGGPVVRADASAGHGVSGGPDPLDVRLPPLPPRRRRTLRAALLTTAVAAAVVVLLALGRLLTPPAADAVPAGVLVQYGYRLAVPAGWEHTGGLPERRRVLLTPQAAPEGSDVIAVERSPLGYDTGAEPERAQAELRAVYDGAVAAGAALAGYTTDARFAGRTVTAYREQRAGRTVVDWYVVLDGDAQLSVGCGHTPAGAEAVRAACAVVVASLRRD